MDNLIQLIKEIKKEEFKVNAIKESLREKVEKLIESHILGKYGYVKLSTDGYDFALHKVECKAWLNGLTLGECHIELIFVCSSKVDKPKKKAIEKAIEVGQFWASSHKKPLWYKCRYSHIKLKDAIEGNINLKLEL